MLEQRATREAAARVGVEAGRETLEVPLGGAARGRTQQEHQTRQPHAGAVHEARGQQTDAEIGDQISQDGVHVARAGGREWSGRLDLNQRPPAPMQVRYQAALRPDQQGDTDNKGRSDDSQVRRSLRISTCRRAS